MARALTHAGRAVHFTTVARWKRQGLLTIATSSDPVADMQRVQTMESAEPQAGREDPFAELPPPVTPRPPLKLLQDGGQTFRGPGEFARLPAKAFAVRLIKSRRSTTFPPLLTSSMKFCGINGT